ncbi:hypothetical protein [[Micrococcus luteus] ATCC 49442]|uniref:hypothetical protein n=1 Tax=[Micrococcus luteus] ATCC 49442 TaxID=2698727 RepID=UPI0013DD6449|nr:hypothetical protein [[Micrococcus luteus] ATCC 49442]
MGADRATARRHVYGGAHITPAIYSSWQVKQYLLATETPGRFGWFDNCGAAA